MGRDDRRRDGEGRRERAQRERGPRLKRVEREDRPQSRQRGREEQTGARERGREERSRVREGGEPGRRGQGGRHRADNARKEGSSMTWLWVVLGLIVVGVIVWLLFFRDSASAAVSTALLVFPRGVSPRGRMNKVKQWFEAAHARIVAS
jgi:hypothetical protein